MIQVGKFNEMEVIRMAVPGAYLDDWKEGILLPNRFVPAGCKTGDTLKVFLYHDSEDRLIATTQDPKLLLDEIGALEVKSITAYGAFLDWGLMKDLFVPKSQQHRPMRPGGRYVIKVYMDEQTGRLAGTEKFESSLSNEKLTVKEKEAVHLTALRRTDIGYLMIINHCHTGVLHFNEIYRSISEGDSFQGFIKKIYADNRIDVVAGQMGFKRVETESEKILRLLQENNGYLPYYDKSDPDEIYDFFGMSKKTFKMAIGGLYKQRKISLEKTGIRLTGS